MTKSSKTHDNSNLKLTVFWGDILYDTTLCHPNEAITIGPQIGNTFVLPVELESHSFELIKVRSDNSAILKFTDHLDGHVRIGKDFLSFSSARKSKHVVQTSPGVYQVELGPQDKELSPLTKNMS
jgi:hypothetical protein